MNTSSKKIIAAASIGSGVNLLLFFVKLYIGLSTNSVAIYADSLNSLLDFGVCLAAVAGFVLLTSKKSDKFPFGKGRAEDLLDFIISVVILITGAGFAYASLERILYPMPVWYSQLYAGIIAATAAVKLALAAYFAALRKKTDSKTISGLSTDSILDFFITLCTLFSFTLSEKLGYSADGAAGMIISILLIAEGIKMTVSACKRLLGERDFRACERAEKIIKADGNVDAVYDIQCHSYGETKIFTAKIKCKKTEEIIQTSARLEEKIKNELNAQAFFNFGEKYEN